MKSSKSAINLLVLGDLANVPYFICDYVHNPMEITGTQLADLTQRGGRFLIRTSRLKDQGLFDQGHKSQN